MVLHELINIIESVAPLEWQEAWDNSGLQIGDRNAEISKALLTMDVTESVVNEAINLGCELIISHHPLLFHGLKAITGTTAVDRCVQNAIRHGIAIYSAHTSMDSALHGVSGRMADKLEVKNYRILQGEEHGLGVIGELDEALTWQDFLELVKTRFDAPMLRYVENKSGQVKRVALCGGAGAELMEEAIKQGADVFVSADMKYHEMQQGEGQIGLVDMDHWVSEHFTRDIFAELLQGSVENDYQSKRPESGQDF